MNNSTTFNLYVDGIQQDALSASSGSRFANAKILFGANGVYSAPTGMVLDDVALLSSPVTVDEGLDYRTAVNETAFPLIDEVFDIQSSCTSCPTIANGTLAFPSSANGLNLGYKLTQPASTAKLLSMKFKIDATPTSGRIATIQSQNADALKLWLDYDLSTNRLTAHAASNTVSASVFTTTLVADSWAMVSVLAKTSELTTTFTFALENNPIGTIALPGRFRKATVSLGAVPGAVSATGMTIDDISVSIPVIANNETVAVNQITALMSGDVITPYTVKTPIYSFFVDNVIPQITLVDDVIGRKWMVDGMVSARMLINDMSNLTDLQIINTDTNTRIPLSMSRPDATTTAIKVFYPEALLNQNLQQLSLKITTTDSAQNSIVQIKTIDVDNDAPVLIGGVIRAKVNGNYTALTANSTVTRTNNLDLHVKWTNITDRKAISLRRLEYTYQTISDTIAVNQLITNTNTVTRTSSMSVPEGSRVVAGVRLRDEIDNEDLVPLSPVYVDSAVTPDYTQISKNPNDIYRGWSGPTGCALNASANSGDQKFFATWDSAALRINWQGTDWDTEGDLFIYLDTATGGTLQPYRPSKYVHSDGVTNGDAFVTLPMDMAGRVTTVSSVSGMLNQWQSRLRDVLRGTRISPAAEGSDYVIHVSSAKSMEIFRWNAGSSAWVLVSVVPDYTYSMLTGTAQTDIRVPFSTIGYTVGNPFGMVAFASKADYLLPWVTFPTTNPTANSLSSNKITLTPLINGYRWASLASGVCPRRDMRNPDTTQINASLSSTPNGVTQRAVADVFTNTNPDAMASAVDQTNALCSQLPNDPWCMTVTQLQDTATAGVALMSSLGNTLVTQQAPVIGKNSTVSYTLTVTNPSNRPSKPLYAIVQTYGGIWLTGAINATTSNGIYDGGLYSYHTITTPGYKDFQVVKIASIPANTTRSIPLAAKIDPTKAQSSSFDRINTSSVAKIDVRVVDTAAVTTTGSLEWLNTGRTIEWLNAGLRIDTQAPRQIKPDKQLVVGTGAIRLSGSVSDDSAVPSVALEYSSSESAVATPGVCGAAVSGRWSCAVTVPSAATYISYRVRAADTYGQMSPWSAWYRSTVDRDNPTFVFDTNSTNALSAAYVGGSTISIGGLITDTTTTASIQYCDDQQAVCTSITPIGGAIATTAIYTTTVSSPSTAIAAQPCNATSFEGYTAYPIAVTNVADGRVDSLSVSTTIAHTAAQEVDLWLQSPSGTRVQLLTVTRGSASNLRVTFADDAISTTATLLGNTGLSDAYRRVHPDGDIATFSGEAGSGTWKLLACDRNTNGTTGTINNAQMVIHTSGAARHRAAVWSTLVANTNGQDGITRRVRFMAIDSVGKVSASRSALMNIDTVAPSLNVTQNDTIIFPGGSSNAFQGSVGDGGTLDTLQAVVTSATSGNTVATYTLSPVAITSATQLRLNYVQQRSLQTYSWNVTPAQLSALATGRYTVQFVVRDVVGNQRASNVYAFTIPAKTIASLNDINVTGSTAANVQTINTRVDTGFAGTTIDAQIALDSNTSTYTDTTTVHGWAYNGNVDSTLQAAIPVAVQAATITKLEMNNDFAAFLDQDGKLRTWPVDGRADHLSTSNQIAGTTPITNVVQFSIADQFEWDNYLLTLDTNGAVKEYRQADGNPTVTNSVVTIKNRSGQIETSKVIAMDAGYHHTLLLLRSGQVITCSNATATCQDTATTSTAAWGYTPATARYGVTQVQAGIDFSVALRSDGIVLVWGDNDPDLHHLDIPSNIKPVTQIATGADHTLALQNDGTVVAWGDNSSGQTTVPGGLTNVVYIAAGANSSAAVTQSGQVRVWGESNFTTTTTACCASAIALNFAYPDPNNSTLTIRAQTITAHQTGSQTSTTVVPAAVALQPTRIVFAGLIPGRRYTYTLTVRNSENSGSPQVYQGTFTNNLAFNRTYLPYLRRDSSTTQPASSGR
ncbi:MAG: proprotein convertase P-domain-containing protein [Chloroflexales bacterium]|nr:proprotein convertase P-domain-containing protein [Chloroflexales bacterium]